MRRFILWLILPVGLLVSFFTLSKNVNPQTIDYVENKQRGVHVFGYIDSTNLQPLIKSNFDWITLVPFGHQEDFDSPTMKYHRGDSLRMRRRDSLWRNKIDLVHSFGFKVFLKPHIWIYSPTKGKWRSNIFPSNDENWKLWQKNYREFILYYARMAEKSNVELFCIGTELTRLSLEKSDFWKNLIRDVRAIYSGKITYAANWYQEYEKITFWDELDYIGIQAYFPLVKNKYPSVSQISKAWNKHIPSIESTHKKFNKKILFTEIGYKSTPDSAIKPWEWIDYSPNQNYTISTETQANCYEAFFNTIWEEKWMAGIHVWQWRSEYMRSGGVDNPDFTPQRKPAEYVISKGLVN